MPGKSYEVHKRYARRIEDAPAWLVQELMKRRTRRLAQVHAEYLLRGEKPDPLVLGTLYRPDAKEERWRRKWFWRLCNQPLYQRMVTEQVIEALFGEGITYDEVIRMYKKAYDMAEGTERAEAMAKIADRFAVMLGMDKAVVNVAEPPRSVASIQDVSFVELIEEEQHRRQQLKDGRSEEGEDSGGGDAEPGVLGSPASAPRDEAEEPPVPLSDRGEAAG